MRTALTRLADGTRVGVDLSAVHVDHAVNGGWRLYLPGGVQVDVRETEAQLWPTPRDVAAELRAASDAAAQARAAEAIAAAGRHQVEAQPGIAAPQATATAEQAAQDAVPVAPILGVQTAPVFVDPAVWERAAAAARANAETARANAQQAETVRVAAQQQVDTVAQQMEAALRANGVKWPSDVQPAPQPAPAAPAVALVPEVLPEPAPAAPAKRKPATKGKGKPATKGKRK